jgi:hypothetical protein
MDVLSKLKSIAPAKTKAICVNLPEEEVRKFDILGETYNLNRSQLMTLAMKSLREQVDAEMRREALEAVAA